MAKGIAVVSGSNNVVFKALETGVITAGSPTTAANVSITGSLGVTDLVTLKNGLTLEGGNLLIKDGHLSASSDLKSGGNLVVKGDAEITGSLKVKGNLEVEGDISQTNINQSNLVIEDAIILVGSGSDASTAEIGMVFGTQNSKAFSLKDGNFYLGDTSDDAQDGNLDSDNDGLGRLVLANLTASATVHALDLRIANSAEVTGSLDVLGNVVLGDSSSDSITLNGVVTATANVALEEDVTIGTFTEGQEADDLLKVVGQIRMPIFTTAGDPLTGSFPIIPADYVANKANYNGHMFYLTGSDSTNWTTTDAAWPQANKWYFNERGDWHASFLVDSSDY